MRSKNSLLRLPGSPAVSGAARLDHHAFRRAIDATNEAIPTVLRKPFMRSLTFI
jgi:hypothetical protein